MILTWQEIIKYREWALIELRIEAKRFVMSGIEVKPNNLTFTDIWVKCVDAEQIKMKNIGKNEFVKIEDIELSYKEKTGLYELLATDKNKTLISFMDGETLEKAAIIDVRAPYRPSASPSTNDRYWQSMTFNAANLDNN